MLAVFAGMVIWLSACSNDSPPSATSTNPPSIGAIQRAYTMKCSLCHGSDGKLMASKAPDLSQSTLSLDERIAIITYGKGTMPPQNGILDAAMIRGISEYIESFKESSSKESSSKESSKE